MLVCQIPGPENQALEAVEESSIPKQKEEPVLFELYMRKSAISKQIRYRT
jgi:hypothetical protein